MVDFAKLCAPFPPEVVSWRVGSTNADKTRGLALAYIDARDVMRRLDEVCGPENWQRRYPWSDGKRLPCEIGIRVNGEWIWKSDGAGETDVEAEKGAFSDSFKRAAVSWGIGRYLYDLESPWVALEPMGRSYKIAESEYPRLRALLAKSAPTKTVADAKPAPMPEPSPGEPGKPITHTLRAEFVRDFWNRASYTVEVKSDRSGPNWTAWFDWMWQLGQAAPTLDCIVKLQADNKANLAGFRLVSASEHRKLLDHFALVERAHGKVAA